MLHLFGLTVPTPPSQPLDRETAAALAGRMVAAAATLKTGGPAALAADVRKDAQRYLAARRRGELRFAPGTGRPCDEGAWALMRITVDAPAVTARAEPLVA